MKNKKLPKIGLLVTIVTCTPSLFLWGQSSLDEKGKTEEEDIYNMDPFEVVSTQDFGYHATNSGSVTGLGTPILDTPFSVSVLTKDFINDKGANDLRDIVRYVSSMTSTTKDEHEIYGRGFLSIIKVDGGEENRGAFSLDMVERIEVTKGPASILQGRSSAGGVVNAISMKPKFYSINELSATIGSWDYKKFLISSTGPLIDRKLAYLARGVCIDQNGWVDYNYLEEWSYLVGLTYRPFENLEFTVTAQETDRDRNNPQHITYSHPAFHALDLDGIENYDNLGLDRPDSYPQINETVRHWLNRTPGYGVNEPAETLDITNDMYLHGYQTNIQGPQQYRSLNSKRQNAEMRWHVNDWLDIKAQYYQSTADKANVDISTFRPAGGLRINERVVEIKEAQARTFGQIDFASRFKILGTNHSLVVGYQYRSNSGGTRDSEGNLARRRTPVISYNPRTDGVRYIMDELDELSSDPVREPDRNRGEAHSNATYIVDVIEAFDEDLHVMLGGRHVSRKAGGIEESKATPQVGAVYKLPYFDGISVYASYAESFTPNFARDGFGNLIPPKEEINKEVGFKFQMMDGFISGSASVFNLEQKNVALRDFAAEAETDISPIYTYSGLARSEGAEADLVITVSRNYQIIMAWSRLWEARTVESDDELQAGVRLNNAPEAMFSLYNKYTFIDGKLKGAFLAGGIRWTDEIRVHPSWSAPIYSEPHFYADFLVGYRWDLTDKTQAEISFRIENLFNSQYLDGTFRPSEPIRGYMNAKLKF